MKKLVLLSVILLSIASDVMGHAYFIRRKNCWGLHVSPRYKTGASAQCGGPITQDVDRSCNINISSYAAQSCSPWAKAWCSAETGPGYRSGVTSYSPRYFGSNLGMPLDYSDACYSVVPFTEDMPANDSTADPDDGGTYTTFSCTDITFNDANHSITLQGLEGYFKLENDDLANKFSTIRLNIYDESSGLPFDESPVLVTSKTVFLYGGALIQEGQLDNLNFQQTNQGSTILYTLLPTNYTIQLPPNIDLEHVALEFSNDAGNMANGVARPFQIDFEGAQVQEINKKLLEAMPIKFDLMENPVASALRYTFGNKQSEIIQVTFALQDLNGKTIREFSKTAFNPSESREFNEDISGVKSGVYLLVAMTSDQKKYSRKVVKL